MNIAQSFSITQLGQSHLPPSDSLHGRVLTSAHVLLTSCQEQRNDMRMLVLWDTEQELQQKETCSNILWAALT